MVGSMNLQFVHPFGAWCDWHWCHQWTWKTTLLSHLCLLVTWKCEEVSFTKP